MPYDITMCQAGECTLKANCIRFTGAIYGRTNFFGTPPFNKMTNSCDHFLSDRPSEKFTQERAYQLWENDGKQSGKDLIYWLKAENELIEAYRNS